MKKTSRRFSTYINENDETILFDTLWRNGEFRIEPTLQGECDYIQKFIDLDKDSHDEFDLNVFVSMEMEGTFDGCSTYFRGNITKDLQDQIYESDLSVHEYLTEELKYEHTDTEYYINGPIDVREVEKRKW